MVTGNRKPAREYEEPGSPECNFCRGLCGAQQRSLWSSTPEKMLSKVLYKARLQHRKLVGVLSSEELKAITVSMRRFRKQNSAQKYENTKALWEHREL